MVGSKVGHSKRKCARVSGAALHRIHVASVPSLNLLDGSLQWIFAYKELDFNHRLVSVEGV